jgi:hypothetical protein
MKKPKSKASTSLSMAKSFRKVGKPALVYRAVGTGEGDVRVVLPAPK